jgi:hypothetical protein
MPDKAYSLTFDSNPADDALYGDVRELEVDERLDSATTFRLRVGLTKQAGGDWNYPSDDRFSLFTNVGVSVGFAGSAETDAFGNAIGGGGLEPVFDGYITQVNVHMGADADDVYLEACGMDASVLLSLEEKAATWPNMADSDIVQQIVSDYGYNVQVEPTQPVRQDTDTLVIQRTNDAQFVRSLARRNGYEFYFRKDPSSGDINCTFGPPNLAGTPQPDLSIQFGEDNNLMSFEAVMTGLRPLAVDVQQLDAPAKQSNDGNAGSIQLTSLGQNDLSALIASKLNGLVTPLVDQAQMLLVAQPTADATELQTVAQAVRDEAGWFIAATGEINSNAYGQVLRTGGLVLVKGAGQQYSGNYYVTRVTHLIKSSGSYVQHFEARRNALEVDGSEQFGSGSTSSLGVLAG